MAVRDKISVSDSTGATLVGPQAFQDGCILQNRGSKRAFGTFNGDTAVDDIGFSIDPGETLNTILMPAEAKLGTWKFVCATGEITTLYWAFE